MVISNYFELNMCSSSFFLFQPKFFHVKFCCSSRIVVGTLFIVLNLPWGTASFTALRNQGTILCRLIFLLLRHPLLGQPTGI